MSDSAIKKVRVTIGDDGLGYYTGIYGNGEAGPRSEGYGSKNYPPAQNLAAARRAAERDFPGTEITEGE